MTLAQLKRILQPGATLTMTFNSWGAGKQKLIGIPRKVFAVQSTGLTLENPDKPGTRGSFLDWPKASLCDITDDTITIYESGTRPLTKEEQALLDNMPSRREENKELVQRDLMTDSSQTFWMDKRYTKEHDANWYWEKSKGLRYSHNDGGIMHDDNVKGEKSLAYTFKAKS